MLLRLLLVAVVALAAGAAAEMSVSASNGVLQFDTGAGGDAVFALHAGSVSLTAVLDRIAALEEDNTSLKDELNTLKDTTIPGLVARIAALEGKPDLTSRVSSVETDVATLKDTTVPGIASRVGTLEGKPDLTSRVSAVEADVATLKDTTVPGVASRVTTLEGKPDLTARVSSVETDVATLKDTTVPGVASRVTALEGKPDLTARVSALESTMSSTAKQSDLTAIEADIDKLTPKVLWETRTSGSYNLVDIFRGIRSSGALGPHVYECVLRTDNSAHWTGRWFLALVNLYNDGNLGNAYPHRFADEVGLNAGSSGCSGGLTSFSISSGAFSFDSGNCAQKITLACNPPMY